MSLHAQIEKLQQQRQREIEGLRFRVFTLGDALEKGPRQWVQAHPYLTTGGAAVVGFLAAQLGPSLFRKGINPSSPATPPAHHPASPADAPVSNDTPPAPASPMAAVLPLLVSLAEQFLQPPPESQPSTLRIANAGAVEGTTFPVGFPLPGSAN